MRSFVLLVVLVIVSSVTKAQQSYTIRGKINGLTSPAKVVLSYQLSNKEDVKDAVLAEDGRFSFTGVISHPYFVTIELTPGDKQSFFLSGGETTITGGNMREATIRNPVQDEYMEYKASVKPLEEPILSVSRRLFSTDNKDSVALLQAKRADLEKQYTALDIRFVKLHPESYVSFNLVKSYAVVISDPATFEEMYNALAPSFRNSPEGKHMGEDLRGVKQFAIGHKAANFTQPDVDGKLVSLSSFKGKYVLIDFWASWCGPCRAEYPFLHQAYDKYKDKGFDIIAISIDDKKDLWTKSIAQNKFTWTEVSDLKGRQNEAARLYGVSAIPQNLLIDPKGVIIAKNLRGEALIEKLKEVIKD